MLFIAHFLEA